ncbi:MAG: magnesium transporter, partial [Sphingomonadaceae bacterium]|nr:magnesium transporter [Sphingomonadaceae bacterium]
NILYMSAPLIAGTEGHRWSLAPTGFVLSRERLVTVRFAELGAFDEIHKEVDGKNVTAPHILVRLLEDVVDHDADHLERAAERLADCAQSIFAEAPQKNKRLGRETRRLRHLMIEIGQISEKLTRVRHTFLTIGRMASFIHDRCDWHLGDDIRARLDMIAKDIASLDEFENSLAGRVQLMLDAANNFISIEQNDVVKVLTVVSVAGVPPVLVVGVYGMNFKYMPELNWSFGYPFALGLMVVSTILPVLWFKWRDWL